MMKGKGLSLVEREEYIAWLTSPTNPRRVMPSSAKVYASALSGPKSRDRMYVFDRYDEFLKSRPAVHADQDVFAPGGGDCAWDTNPEDVDMFVPVELDCAGVAGAGQ